jgi:hypothetical protein
MGDPFRDRRFNAAEVRRIVRRAATLADESPDALADGRSLTLDEIERAAGDLGVSARAVAMALESPDEPKRPAAPATLGARLLGSPTRLVVEDEVLGEPSESDFEDIVEDIREVFGGENGTIERVGKTFLWTSTPGYQGRGRQISVRLRSRGGRTRIVVEENRTRQAIGLFVGLGVGGGLGPMGGFVAAIVKLGAAGAIFPVFWVPFVFLLARAIFSVMGRRRQRSLEDLAFRLKIDSARWSGGDAVRVAEPSARKRVGGDANARADADADTDADADADADAARRRA